VDLRATLLQRTGRGVVLTEAGQRLFEHGQGVLALVAQAEDAVRASRDEPTGRIVVGMPPTLGKHLAVALVEVFERELPKARLAIVEGLSAHIAEWIATGRVDVGLLYQPEPQPALEIEPLVEQPLLLVSARGRASFGAGKPLPLNQIGEFALVIPERSHAIRRLLEARAALGGFKLQIAWEVSSVPAILALVRSGRGHAVLTADALDGDDARALVTRPLGEPAVVHTLTLVTSASKRATPLQRQVLRRLRELVLARPTS
jgi:LysR family nitrogen assimilation transcriptional regulator